VTDPIVTRAPTRIDFGGGWTDVPPYSDEAGGYVCNVAITRYATVTVTHTPADAEPRLLAGETSAPDRAIVDAARRRFGMHDVRVDVRSDFPIGAGLGGSSAAGVATVAALSAARGDRMMPAAIAELSREIEILDLGIAGGRQDHYAAAYGGALGLRFSDGRVDVRRIPLSEQLRADIERRCVVVYTGQSRVSSDTIRAVMGAYSSRDPEVVTALRRMRESAEQMADALADGDLDRLAALVGAQWTDQRSLHASIPTPLIDEIIARAYEAGALGAKALGASGGGCVLAIAKRDRVRQVRDVAAALGELLSFSIDQTGVERCR
jgi:D-glycero-alpha-D-manno-heptose-7-phosphate kinase